MNPLRLRVTGVGELSAAHSNGECVRVSELWQCVCFLTLYLLRETGTLQNDETR